ncbi:MAG: hypothetical protein HYT08_00605 [Candidatus Levybacteria bacterium]|nr:hypothetical protein [Candidatus Levybacteria bacterium]
MLRIIIFFILLVLAFIYVLGGASGFFDYDLFSLFKKDQWIGFFYENKNNASFLKSDAYSNADACKEWVSNKIEEQNLIQGTYKHECGKNCQFTQDFSSYTCEEIIK